MENTGWDETPKPRDSIFLRRAHLAAAEAAAGDHSPPSSAGQRGRGEESALLPVPHGTAELLPAPEVDFPSSDGLTNYFAVFLPLPCYVPGERFKAQR